MLRQGRHADGLSFHGAGAEKAHAFSPVHSEIHFNDHEQFSLTNLDKRSVSIFYVALHETGHALGLKHSEYQDAIMASGYKQDGQVSLTLFLLHCWGKNVVSENFP